MIKSIFKWLGLGLLAILLLGGSFAAHEWYADKPFMFRAFLDRAMVKMAFANPETLTSLGFLESMGINGHNAHLDDVHPDRSNEQWAKFKAMKAGLLEYADEELSEQEKLSKDVALYLLNFIEAAEPYRYHYYPANQLFGIQNSFPSFMEASHQVNSAEDAEHYISRLKEVKRKFDQYLLDLKIREDKGVIPPRFVIQRVLDEMQAFVDAPIQDNILYQSLDEKLQKVEDLSDDAKVQLLSEAREAIQQFVHPAYQSFLDYFTALLPKGSEDHGYWHLPGGDEAYRLALKFFTTTDYSPEQIHNLGLSEVDRIQAEMLEILASIDIDVSNGYASAMEALSAKTEFYYEDSDEGRAKILADYQTILDEIDAGLDDAFNIRPKAGMEVVRIPEFKEKTAPGAYYQAPSLDNTRPGRFFANLYDIKATPTYSMRTLAYHEGIPGHHFQIAIAMELEGMPFLRRFAPFTAYTEGWALYAERLAAEQGFLPKPEDDLGRLQAELFRAVRLVVDTGIHYKRWTREEAIAYMLNNTGMAESDVVSEIERYIVMPGQATSYKVGMIKILELRQKAMDALGDKFDIRTFHDVVLQNGALPLDLLERIVDGYIAENS